MSNLLCRKGIYFNIISWYILIQILLSNTCVDGFKHCDCGGNSNNSCPDNSECESAHGSECYAGESSCGCTPGSQWDRKLRMCVLKVKTTCTNISGNNSIQQCTTNAICNAHNVCECVHPYYENSEGRCVLLYGHLCNAIDDPCDSTKFMECNRNTQTCDCINIHNSTYYDKDADTCRLLADAPCSPNIRQKCTERASCVPTERFFTQNYDHGTYSCKCKFPSKRNNAGKCFYPLGERCDVVTDFCDPAGFLKCSVETQSCACKPSVYPLEYSTEANSCLYKLGYPCFQTRKGPFCPERSVCTRTSATTASEDGSGVCKCSPGYENPDGPTTPCLKSFGMQCTSPTECNTNQHLSCIDGICKCNSESLVPVNSTVHGKIECLLKFNEPCDSTSALCNNQADLTCSLEEGRCGCFIPGDQFFSPLDQRCFSRLGTRCLANQTEFSLKCQTNAECVPEASDSSLYGICHCLKGFTEHLSNNTCSVPSSSTRISISIGFPILWFSLVFYL